ncbi:MAG TPA: AAA family ATPase [Thermoanaerobaculia bacterium]|nr:AAA family ATPase [Thermoanaerobaculia bacterium]
MIEEPTTREISWLEANRACLEAELRRLRLLLHRRVLWLRRQWKHDPLQAWQGLVISDAQADSLLAGDDPAAEARFYRDDPDAAAVGRALANAERQAAELRRELAEAGTPPALDLLVDMLGLSPFEREVLLLALAPEVDPGFERLYAYVQDDASHKQATPHLALSLYGGGPPGGSGGSGDPGDPADPGNPGRHPERRADREAFQPQAPLRRLCLIAGEPGAPGTAAARPFRLDERMAAYLLGVNRIDERAAALLRPVLAAPLAPPQRELADRLALWLQTGSARERWPIVNLTGPAGSGRKEVARALCDALGVSLQRLDPARLPAPGPERDQALHLLEREAVLLQMAFYLEAGPTDPADRAAATALEEVVDRLSVLLFVGSAERFPTVRESVVARLPALDAGARQALWREALAGVLYCPDGRPDGPLDGHLQEIVQQFDLGQEGISRAVAAARDLAGLRAPRAPRLAENAVAIAPGDLWQACREQAAGHLDALARRLAPCHTWDDIVLPDDAVRQLHEIAGQVACRSRVYEDWGFGAKLSRGRGISALFSGPSGTGKTMAAEVLAGHLDLDLYRIDLSSVVSKYIGETEKNLRRVFDEAERSGAILFFDEADALFGKRSEVKDSHDRYANIEISYLLQRMEEYRGLAILATNLRSHLDQAFLRRLRFLVDFPFPDAAQRQRIWQRVFPPQAAVEGLDWAALARLEVPGGNIKNIALNASFLAAGEGGPVRMEHALRAARREYVKIEKLVSEADFGAHAGGPTR